MVSRLIEFDRKYRRVTDVTSTDKAPRVLLSSAQVRAVELVIENLREEGRLDTNRNEVVKRTFSLRDPRLAIALNNINRPIVYLAQYNVHPEADDSHQEVAVFVSEEAAWSFLIHKRDQEGITNLAVTPRVVIQ